MSRTLDVVRMSDVPDIYTYFVQGEQGGNIKIGVSKDPDRRVRDMQTGSPERLVLLGTLGEDQEQELHARFTHLRQHGEWFSPAPELVSFLTRSGCSKPHSRPIDLALCAEVTTPEQRWAERFGGEFIPYPQDDDDVYAWAHDIAWKLTGGKISDMCQCEKAGCPAGIGDTAGECWECECECEACATHMGLERLTDLSWVGAVVSHARAHVVAIGKPHKKQATEGVTAILAAVQDYLDLPGYGFHVMWTDGKTEWIWDTTDIVFMKAGLYRP